MPSWYACIPPFLPFEINPVLHNALVASPAAVLSIAFPHNHVFPVLSTARLAGGDISGKPVSPGNVRQKGVDLGSHSLLVQDSHNL